MNLFSPFFWDPTQPISFVFLVVRVAFCIFIGCFWPQLGLSLSRVLNPSMSYYVDLFTLCFQSLSSLFICSIFPFLSNLYHGRHPISISSIHIHVYAHVSIVIDYHLTTHLHNLRDTLHLPFPTSPKLNDNRAMIFVRS
jgi:hypothetical protein